MKKSYYIVVRNKNENEVMLYLLADTTPYPHDIGAFQAMIIIGEKGGAKSMDELLEKYAVIAMERGLTIAQVARALGDINTEAIKNATKQCNCPGCVNARARDKMKENGDDLENILADLFIGGLGGLMKEIFKNREEKPDVKRG